MSNREFTATRTMLANAFATAGAELLAYMGSSSALAAIPETDPPKYVAAGPLDEIAKLLPAFDKPAAATVLTIESIVQLMDQHTDRDFGLIIEPFARAIEREVLAQAGVTAEPADKVQSEKPHDLTIREAFDAVGGWMNGGEMGYPSFGSFEALSIYTTKMIRSFLGNKAWHERNDAQVPAAEVRAQALEDVAKLIDTKVYNYQDECGIYDHSTGVTEYPGNGAEWICEMQELAEEIRSLAKEAAAQVPAAEWISVEDRLPEDKQHVAFVVDTQGWERFDYLHGRVLGGQFTKSDHHFSVPGLGFAASHWMPLPAAPSTATSNDTGALGDTGGAK